MHLVRLQNAGHREDVADVVIDDQHFLAGENGLGLVQAARAIRGVPSVICATGRCRNRETSSSSRSGERTSLSTVVCVSRLMCISSFLVVRLRGIEQDREVGERGMFADFVDQIEAL